MDARTQTLAVGTSPRGSMGPNIAIPRSLSESPTVGFLISPESLTVRRELFFLFAASMAPNMVSMAARPILLPR